MKTKTSALLALSVLFASAAVSAAETPVPCEATIAPGSDFRGVVRRALKKKGYRIADEATAATLDVSVEDYRPGFIEVWLGLSTRRVTVKMDIPAAAEFKREFPEGDPRKRRHRKAYVKQVIAESVPECI